MQISSTMPTTRLLCYVLTLSVYLFGMHVSALHRRQLFGTFMHHPAVASLFESPNRNGNICHATKKGQFKTYETEYDSNSCATASDSEIAQRSMFSFWKM